VTGRALVLAILLTLLVAVPAAHAGTATVVDSTLSYIAGAGETNTVSIAYDNTLGAYRITDTTAPVMGGPGCGAVDQEIDCEDKGIQIVIVNLRDGNDKWTGGDIKLTPSVEGGDGNDELSGIGFLSGGPGDDVLRGTDGGSQMDGGPGNDTLAGGDGADQIDGGPGDDLLIGNDGDDFLLGGEGLDRIDTTGGGADQVNCQGRDDEIIQVGDDVTRQSCTAAPVVKVAPTRVKVSRLLSGGMPFTVTCDKPCAVTWELRLGGKLRKLVHHSGAWIDRGLAKLDKDGFMDPVDGAQHFTAHVVGNATKKGLKRLKSLDAALYVRAYGRDGLAATVTKKLRIG
jgi:hypothetical protein